MNFFLLLFKKIVTLGVVCKIETYVTSFPICSGGGKEQRILLSSKLLDGSSEFVLTYEDREGDWMLVGDVPWGYVVTLILLSDSLFRTRAFEKLIPIVELYLHFLE